LGNCTERQLSDEDYLPLEDHLFKFHDVFSLEEDQKGEGVWLSFTAEGMNYQTARRILCAVRQEVAKHSEKCAVLLDHQHIQMCQLVRKRMEHYNFVLTTEP